MAGINGIGGIPEPIPVRPANTRDRKGGDVQSTAATSQDDVAISSEAQEAAGVARLTQANTGPDIRADRVAAARESLERGDYKRQDVVEEVARRVSKYLG